MSTIRRSLSTRVDGDGKSEVYLRFSGGRGKVFRVKSGIRVPASRWNARTGDVVLPRIATPEQEELLEARRRLDELCNMLMAEYASADKDAVDSEWFAAAVHRFAHPDARVSGAGPECPGALPRACALRHVPLKAGGCAHRQLGGSLCVRGLPAQ